MLPFAGFLANQLGHCPVSWRRSQIRCSTPWSSFRLFHWAQLSLVVELYLATSSREGRLESVSFHCRTGWMSRSWSWATLNSSYLSKSASEVMATLACISVRGRERASRHDSWLFTWRLSRDPVVHSGYSCRAGRVFKVTSIEVTMKLFDCFHNCN